MILFKSDWARFPTAIRDYDTTNESFLRLAGLYRKMGIENYDFVLALYQPELVGVDPHDPNLDLETKKMVRKEATYNPWYFFREVVRIPPTSGSVPLRFKANRGNIALYWSFFNHVDFGLLQPRQTGKSVSTDVLMTGVKDVWGTNTKINLITKDAALRVANVERLKEMRDYLPDYIYYPNPDDANNSESLTNKLLKNIYRTSVGRNDRVAADKLGRGLTVPIMHFDELAYINLIEHSLPVALASGSEARDQAAEMNQHYGNIYTTTAGNIDSRDGKYAHKFMTGGAVWTEKYFDLPTQEALYKVIEKASRTEKLLIYGAFNHRQLGRTDEWMARKLRENAMSGDVADRDMFNIWSIGSSGSPLTRPEKAQVKQSQREPEYIEITDENYVLNWFIPKHEIAGRMASGNFVMGLDPSETLGDDVDSTGVVVIDVTTHDTIMTARVNETNTTLFAKFIADYLIRYERVLFIPERKSTWTTIVETLFIQLPLAGQDPFRRIYNRIVDEQDTLASEFREISKPLAARPAYFYDKYKRYFGFNTSGSGRHAREALYGEALKNAVRLGGRRVKDQTLINELLSLTTKNGRIDHSSGNHDDMVIAWLLAHWVLTKGRNLKYYGIDSSRVFADAVVDRDMMTGTQRYEYERQGRLKERFDALMEELRESDDPIAIQRLEMQIRRLSTDLDVQTGSTGEGIDAMIRSAQEERGRRRKLHRTQRPGRGAIRGRRFGNGNQVRI